MKEKLKQKKKCLKKELKEHHDKNKEKLENLKKELISTINDLTLKYKRVGGSAGRGEEEGGRQMNGDVSACMAL